MKLTDREARALEFIRASCAGGLNPSVTSVKAVLTKISFGTAHNILCRLREAGLVDWIDGQQRTLHPTGAAKQAVRPTPLYRIQAEVVWPLKNWKPSDGVWLDPKMFNLKSTEKCIVIQAGTLWAPQGFPVAPGEKFVVALRGPSLDGELSFFQRVGRLEAATVFSDLKGSFRVKGKGTPIASADFLGVIVSRVSSQANF